MPSHSEGPGIWLSVWRFLLTHCLYERAAKVLARLRGCAWTFAARIGDKYQIRLTRSICVNLKVKIPFWLQIIKRVNMYCLKMAFWTWPFKGCSKIVSIRKNIVAVICFIQQLGGLTYAFLWQGCVAGKSKLAPPPPIHITAKPKNIPIRIMWSKIITYSYYLYPNPYLRKLDFIILKRTSV